MFVRLFVTYRLFNAPATNIDDIYTQLSLCKSYQISKFLKQICQVKGVVNMEITMQHYK